MFEKQKEIVFEIALFSLSLFLGILSGWRLRELFESWMVSSPVVSIWQFVISVLILTAAVLLAIIFLRNKKKKVFFRGIFLLAAILGNLFFFSLWFSDIVSLIIVIILTILWLKKPIVVFHDLFLILAIAGIGARIGLSLEPRAVIILLIIFSIYDYIAVYKTKHMVKMAKEMIAQKSILGIVIPQDISGFKAGLSLVEPGGRFLILGAGDIVFPLILSVSLIYQGVLFSIIIAIFSLAGLLLGYLIFRKKRKPIPALPPIALFCIIGYLITLIL